MSDSIRNFTSDLPFQNLREITIKEQVYRAYGELQIGVNLCPVEIRVWLQDGVPKLEVKSKQAQIYAVYPFSTKNEQADAKIDFNNLLLRWWN